MFVQIFFYFREWAQIKKVPGFLHNLNCEILGYRLTAAYFILLCYQGITIHTLFFLVGRIAKL